MSVSLVQSSESESCSAFVCEGGDMFADWVDDEKLRYACSINPNHSKTILEFSLD